MKKLLTLLCAVGLVLPALAQKPVLRFGQDGKIRIAQFTDVHFKSQNKPEAEKALSQMCYILDTEHPDLVVFTGDVVTAAPAAEGWKMVLAPVVERKLPFCVVLGNHDAEQDLTREQIAALVTAYPTSFNTLKNGQLDDIAIEVLGADGKTATVFYCLDSNDYSLIEGVEGYGWFRQNQIDWYRELSAAYTAKNGGKPLPSLSFFHIPLPEYGAAWRNPENTRIGRAAEDECPGAVNPGMFAAMTECGDVMGVFAGHDHDIDYVVAENGIALCYGRFSGANTIYNNLRHGVRLISLTQGERGFETWIREGDGRVVDHVEFREGKVHKIKK